MQENRSGWENGLKGEKSPYLLQHAQNPVNWYPWGEKAFQKARAENKPIFLSIGYSTCHWCHEMERESFEDEEVAKLLNDNYISIKVDREERPDIDKIYMDACQALTGHGGWPLTIIMTPDKLPFFAATYLPKKSRSGLSGMMEVLPYLAGLWKDEHEKVIESSESIKDAINKFNTQTPGKTISAETIHRAYEDFARIFDSEHGGFGSAPKFPVPHILLFLMRYFHMTGDANALEMVEKTLEKMYMGGIYDHIGFGFARYSTDRQWLVPHFEKMLYDNALLIIAYLEAYQLTQKREYAVIAEEILAYIKREMVSVQGGFYTAQDADSEGEEGKYYIWDVDEILTILGTQAGQEFCEIYDIKRKGNFNGRNIPNLLNRQFGKEDSEKIARWRKKLLSYREKRVRPFKDDKILTSWNGLMIAAFAKAYRILHNPDYLQTAEKAVDFILSRLIRADGRLLARYREGQADYLAYSADYAYLVWGLIELYEAGFNSGYLKKALELNEELLRLFWDEENGGIYLYGDDGERLFTRPKESYDGAIPSANSVALMNFLRLARLTGNTSWEEKAQEIIRSCSNTVRGSLTGHAFFLSSIIFTLNSPKEIVVTGKKDDQQTISMLKEIHQHYMPNATIAFKDVHNEKTITQIADYTKEMKMVAEKPTAYICENYACQEPITSILQLEQRLKSIF